MDVLGMSMRICPLLARNICDADCCGGAPGCALCVTVWHCEHEGGAGTGGAAGGENKATEISLSRARYYLR
jgi:hypothetical protein